MSEQDHIRGRSSKSSEEITGETKMNDLSTPASDLLSRQQMIQSRCFHPSNTFVEFKKEEIEQSVANRFEQQVRKYPNRLAVKTSTCELTYTELNKAANRLARAIVAQGGRAEEPVALLLEQGASMIVAIMAVLKAGKIYVPLDPSYPLARTAYIVEDSQASLMVTNNKNLTLAHELAQKKGQLINIDEIDTNSSSENPGLSVSPDSIAYILYTSGSTGQPKGVFQNHRNLLHDIRQYTNTLHICCYDRLTLLSSCSVSGSLRDIFGALLNGAALCPFNIEEKGLTDLAAWLMQEEITFYHSVPTVFRHFIDTLTGQEEFPHLRMIRFGGERVPTRSVELYKRHFSPACIVYVRLGATETGTIRHCFIDQETRINESIVPAGFAVEGTEVFLLDETGEKMSLSGVGEIAVKSRYLALGYWRKPDLTRAAFLPDPKGGSERIYRTGDMGRLLPDGCLIHLGRKDFQVKVRGYRIEVAEVEMALLKHPAVKEAVVVAREDERDGEQHLVAYLVVHQEKVPTINELRGALKEKLPDYMLPSAFVKLDALPLTPNGKVDRLALPAPEQTRSDFKAPYVEPRNELEKSLAKTWCEVLRVDKVGIHDNFFELGGHSLLATRVVSRVQADFHVKLPLREFFESPTVAELALMIEEMLIQEIEELTEEEAQRSVKRLD